MEAMNSAMEILGEVMDGSRVVCWTVQGRSRASDFSDSLQHLGKREEGQTNRDLALTSASTLASYAFNSSEPKIETPMRKKQMLSGQNNTGAFL